MNTERDKFLTEAIGEKFSPHPIDNTGTVFYNFSTWEGFGKLLEGMLENDEVGIIVTQQLLKRVIIKSMDNIPDRFANTVCEFLKNKG